jgi:glycosyltransferase involved in cell wall biosynthesis
VGSRYRPAARMKVAYYSPLPPSRSGIADYSALLLPALEKRIEVEIARPVRFRRTPKADVALYHVGNDPEAHGWIVEAMRRRPGVVVLHELVLHHLVAGITLARGDAPGYLAAMERDYGLAGRLLAYGVLDNRIPPLWETRPQDFPLAGEILRLAQSLVVHSRYVEEGARAAGYEGRIALIPHPAWARPAEIATVGNLIGCFGHLNESKRIPQLYAAFARLRERLPDARLLVVGGASRRLADLDMPEGVTREDYVDEERLWSLMSECDVIVSLRSPTMGETSGTVIRALSAGRPLVVSDIGWFSELPDTVAVKVAPDEREVETLAAELERLLSNDEGRGTMSAAALQLATTEHALDRIADLYVATLEEAAGGEAVREAVTREVVEAAAEVGIGPDVPEAKELAARLREAELG